VLDVCFREDEQRHWAGHSAENLSWMRKLALCLLKAEPTNKAKAHLPTEWVENRG